MLNEMNPKIVMVPNYDRMGEIVNEVAINVDEVKYLQVCMVGAKLGQSHRKGDREFGRIYKREHLRITEHSLKGLLVDLKLKPRSKEHYELQLKEGVAAVPWQGHVLPLDTRFDPHVPIETQREIRDAKRERIFAERKAEAERLAKEKQKLLAVELAPVTEEADEEEDDWDEEEEKEEDEDAPLEDAPTDPRTGTSYKPFWKDNKVEGKRAAVCPGCKEERFTAESLWKCWDTVECGQKRNQ